MRGEPNEPWWEDDLYWEYQHYTELEETLEEILELGEDDPEAALDELEGVYEDVGVLREHIEQIHEREPDYAEMSVWAPEDDSGKGFLRRLFGL